VSIDPETSDQQPRAAFQPRMVFDRLQHRRLEFGLEVRRIPRRRDEAVGQNAIDAHGLDRPRDRLARDFRLLHQPEVAQQREAAELLLGDQPLERLALVASRGKRDLPGVGR
jgi:hypothetical protein